MTQQLNIIKTSPKNNTTSLHLKNFKTLPHTPKKNSRLHNEYTQYQIDISLLTDINIKNLLMNYTMVIYMERNWIGLLVKYSLTHLVINYQN